MVKRAAVLAIALGSLAACAQILGIESIHDDAPDASSPVDGSVGVDVAIDHAAGDVAIDAPSGAIDATTDALDAGPTVDPARGCTGPEGGPVSFFPGVSTFPLGIAIDDRGIYVADINSLRRCSIEGCDSGVTLVYPAQPQAFADDGAHIVYCASGVVTLTDSNGIASQSWVASNGCWTVATRGADLFWSTTNAIVHAVDGVDASGEVVLVDPYGDPVALAPTSRKLFFVDKQDPDASPGRVASCDRPTCDAGPAVLGYVSGVPGMIEPSLAANEETVFWADPATLRILACPVDGCDGGARVFVGDASVNGLYADESALYWATSGGGSVFGNVYKTSLDGGATVMLASNMRAPAHVLANAACVYFTEDGFFPAHVPGYVFGVRQP